MDAVAERDKEMVGERCLWRIHSMECMRRKVLAGMAWPLLMSAMGRQAVTASELQEDPILGALVAALDARDMLASLRTSLTKAKSNLGFSGDLETHLRTLNRIYERLEINLPGMVEELEVDKEIVEQLLECLAYARTDLFNQGLLFLTEGQKSGTPRNNLDGSLQLLKLAINQVDLLLQQVPLELVESAQLARGVRPMA